MSEQVLLLENVLSKPPRRGLTKRRGREEERENLKKEFTRAKRKERNRKEGYKTKKQQGRRVKRGIQKIDAFQREEGGLLEKRG